PRRQPSADVAASRDRREVVKLWKDLDLGQPLQNSQRKRRAPDAPARQTQGSTPLAATVNGLVEPAQSARAAQRPVQTLVLLREHPLDGKAPLRWLPPRRPSHEASGAGELVEDREVLDDVGHAWTWW